MFKEAFAILGLDPCFELEAKVLDAHYLERQSIFHPDRFVDSLPAERDLAEMKTAQLNQAYSVLKSPITRARCLLELRGRLDEQTASSELLTEIMTWREKLVAIETPQALTDLDQEITTELEKAFGQFATTFAEDLPQALAIFLRLSYLDKLAQEIKILQTRASVRAF